MKRIGQRGCESISQRCQFFEFQSWIRCILLTITFCINCQRKSCKQCAGKRKNLHKAWSFLDRLRSSSYLPCFMVFQTGAGARRAVTLQHSNLRQFQANECHIRPRKLPRNSVVPESLETGYALSSNTFSVNGHWLMSTCTLYVRSS